MFFCTYLFVEPNRRRDPSNIVAGGVKLIEDALQEIEIIENDNWGSVAGFSAHWTTDTELPGALLCIDPEIGLSREEMVNEYWGGREFRAKREASRDYMDAGRALGDGRNLAGPVKTAAKRSRPRHGLRPQCGSGTRSMPIEDFVRGARKGGPR
jgi:hypothetical protein